MVNEQNILIVEDDSEIASVVAMNVKDLGYAPVIRHSGPEGLRTALDEPFALVILDIMLPGLEGMEVCRKIREKDPLTPVMMLTARTEEIDRVLGLEIGADDYMTKPFSLRELTARIKALIRRSQTNRESREEENRNIRIGRLSMEPAGRKVLLDRKELDLTAKEYDLLSLFMNNPGRAYSRADLLNSIWGYQFEGYEHTVNTHINRLRNKIEPDPSSPRYLKTLWGVGYKFSDHPEEP